MTSVKWQEKNVENFNCFQLHIMKFDIRFQEVARFYYLALVKTGKGDSPVCEVIEILCAPPVWTGVNWELDSSLHGAYSELTRLPEERWRYWINYFYKVYSRED